MNLSFNDSANFKYENNPEIKAKLLIAADGANSFVRDFAKIDVIKKDYNKTALVFNVKLEKTHSFIAYERFFKDITLALVPFGEYHYKCILMVPNNLVQLYKEYTEPQLINEIYKIIGLRIGKINQLGPVISYPLTKIVAKELYREGLVLIGNAANTILPIAAQGLNLGLRDVATLLEILVENKKILDSDLNYTNFNCTNIFSKYSDLRKIDHTKTTNFADNIIKLFEIDFYPIPFIRSLGLTIAGICKPLQNLIVQEGLGTKKNLSKLGLGMDVVDV